jgi:hypothetical protein
MKNALILFSSVIMLNVSLVQAQLFKKKQADPPTSVEVLIPREIIAVKEESKKDEFKNINEATRKFKRYDGLFTIYQDTLTGNLYMLIKKEQIGKEYIYFSHTVDGISATGHFRGNYRENLIFSIQKYYNKLEFVAENLSYHYDPKSPLSKAAGANTSTSVMISQKIVAESRDQNEMLIRADDLFMTEYLSQLKTQANQIKSLFSNISLGSLNKEKSKYMSINSYPENTDVVVDYVFDNHSASGKSGEVADSRYMSIKIQHSFVEVPENNFKPRGDDARVGYFTRQLTELTSSSATPYLDFIQKWHLEKKDKTAEVSEPVEPIVFWLENTTPKEYRETIESAVLAWNEAFEEAGFRNAIHVKIQPDDAEWDAGDIRYNVIRWTASPSPVFGGYGPAFFNPRTGQILGADIMIEYSYLTNRLKQEKLFHTSGLEMDGHTDDESENYCAFGQFLQMTSLFGLTALDINKPDDTERDDYIRSALYYLILHEVGHTLGLTHNMRASQLHSLEDINNKGITLKKGLCASVMDYPAVNLASEKEHQGHFFTSKPGPYDKWAILYGYSESLINEKEEKQRLNHILSLSTKPELAYGNDADDMRTPGKGIDPRVMTGDISSDAISYSVERIKLINKLTGKLKEQYTVKDESYHQLRNAYLILTTELNNSAAIISRYIGGVYVERDFAGQENGRVPFTPVPLKEQKKAMLALSKYVFSPDAFSAPGSLYTYLQMQRRGFGFAGNTEDPKIHERALKIQKNVLDHVLHPVVMRRITDTELYGNAYKLPEVLNDLSSAIFKDDMNKSVNTFRQNIQIEYINRLIEIINDKGDKHDSRSQSLALDQLRQIEKSFKLNPGIDQETQAHRQHINHIIAKALDK